MLPLFASHFFNPIAKKLNRALALVLRMISIVKGLSALPLSCMLPLPLLNPR